MRPLNLSEIVVPDLDDDQIMESIIREAKAKQIQIGLAESCTGGLIAKRMTDIAGASQVFVGGIVAYDDRIKIDLLGVEASTIKRWGAVSAEVAEEMAIGAQQSLGADVVLSVTGIAGPGGGSDEKPVGTVWFGAAFDERIGSRLFRFDGTRSEIRDAAARVGLALLLDLLTSTLG